MTHSVFQGILFDADGTLYDSSMLHFAAYREASQILYNFDFTEEIFMDECMKQNKQPTEILRNHGIDCTDEDFYHLKRPSYEKIAKKKLQATHGLKKFLESLQEYDIPIGIVSSATKHSLTTSLEILGLDAFFKVIVSYEDIPNAQKPLPDGYLIGANLIKQSPQDCLVFEDTSVGIRSAKDAGMKCIAIRNTTNTDTELRESDLIIRSYSDLTYTFTSSGINLTFS